jgi:transcriptional regulator with PAS, ATPase and Fis domain
MEKRKIMEQHAWYKVFPGAMTVTNEKGEIIEMNDASAETFKKDGGYQLIGQNIVTCHKEPSQSKVRKLYETHSFNVYSITKNGKKKLVYQAPYFVDGNFSGIVELVLDLPEEIPHHDRDK